MLYPTCTMISSVDLACSGVSRAKDWVYMDCGTTNFSLDNKDRSEKTFYRSSASVAVTA